MIGDLLEMLRQSLLWPGETLIGWLVTAHPQLATWLGLHSTSTRELFSVVVSLTAGWGLFNGICHLLLLIMQRLEAQQAQHNADPLASTKETDA
jgi:hypothetical protein